MGILLYQVGDSGVILINYPITFPLIPGRYYLLENFRTSYFLRKGPSTTTSNWFKNPDRTSYQNNLPTDVVGYTHGSTWSTVFEDAYYGPKERIMFLATGEDSISERVWSLDFPQDEIYMDFKIGDPNRYDSNNTDPHYMGKIYYRKDSTLNIEAPFDWRSVKFARWKLNSDESANRHTSWFASDNQSELFTTGPNESKVKSPSNLANTMEAYHLFGGIENRTPAEIITNNDKPLSSIPVGSYAPPTTLTWCVPGIANPSRFRNIKIGKAKIDDTIWSQRERNNIVIFSPTDINEACINNTIGDENFRASIDGQGFVNNQISNGFENVIACSENTNVASSTFVKTNFRDNNIGFNFKHNLIRQQFLGNHIGDNSMNNDFISTNFPVKNNKIEGNIINNDWQNNSIKNSIIESVFANGFNKNKLIGSNAIIRCKIFKSNVKDVTFSVNTFNSITTTFQGFTSLTDKVLDNNNSTFESGVNFPQSANITNNDPSKLVITDAGFQISGIIYLKPPARPASANPTATEVNLKSIEGGPTFNFILTPVAWDAFGTPDQNTKRYWDWTLNVLSINTKMKINPGPNNSKPISLATEDLKIYSISNDWLMLGLRSFIHDTEGLFFAQITGQNNFFLV